MDGIPRRIMGKQKQYGWVLAVGSFRGSKQSAVLHDEQMLCFPKRPLVCMGNKYPRLGAKQTPS